MYDVYQIMAGDTIDAIANKFGTNSSVIRQLNPNSGFGVGSMIVVPVTNQYFDIYTIKKGDSLYEIARKYTGDPKKAKINIVRMYEEYKKLFNKHV